jgi:hypothetical protein
MNNVLWVFGDSFCTHNSNYINTIFKKGKFKDIKVLGVSSSSTYYSLLTLSENVHLFEPEDSVIVGVTYGNRHYFAENHFCGSAGINKHYDEEKQEYLPTSKYLQDIYTEFFTHLWDLKQGDIINQALKFYIEKGIKKHINVKNFILFDTISTKDFISYRFGLKPHQPAQSMLDTMREFYHEHLGQKDKTTIDIIDENKADNHWITHPDYEEYFWNIYTKLFEPLWLR